MTITGRIIIALVVAAAVATATTYLQSRGSWFDPVLFAALCVATVTTVLLGSMGGQAAAGHQPTPEGRQQAAPSSPTGPAATDAGRESGQVKWFNVSKGFGFITKDDGEEIFVHFRSIRGEGRRSLRDGQRVSFVVAQSDKGPQAEDVVAI